MRRSRTAILAAVVMATLAAGCAMNKTEKGAIIGAGTGGAVGAVVGKATGSTVRGAIIGAAVGGAAGALIGRQMDKQAEELAFELPGATVQRIGEGIAVTFPDGLLFAFDSDQLTSGAQDNLRKFAASLTKYPKTRALIVGHTDSRGSDTYNMNLSVRRAESAARFITGTGVASSRSGTVGRGEAEPIATNDSEDGRRQNRRVEVAIFAIETAAGGSSN